MSRKFSEIEKNFFKQKMIDEATRLFSSFGFKKTSIDDITNAAGIAKGTFYNFFSSKEDILFTVLEEQEKFRDELLADLMANEKSAKTAIRKLIKQSLKETDENQVFKMFFEDNLLLDRLYLKLSPERIEAHFAEDFKKSSQFIKYFQDHSDLIQADPKIIVGLFRAFFMLPLHKKEIGEDIYEDVMALFTKVLAKGLTTNEVKNDQG